MTDRQKRRLVEICQQWNRRVITADSAMNQIWGLFIKENLKEWNKK